MMTLSRGAWLQRVRVLVFGLVLFGATGIYADQAQYIYDDLGRLSQVIDGQGNVATYTYEQIAGGVMITPTRVGWGLRRSRP